MSQWGQPDVDELDPWVLRCPNGHTSFQPINGHWWCRQCACSDRYGTDGSFERVENIQTGDRLDREDVRVLEERAREQQSQRQQVQGD